MIRLIKEFLESAIKMHNAAETAFKIAEQHHEKSIQYLDNIINHDLIRQSKELEILDEQLKRIKNDRI
jgi:hypothetical protein